ncbi:LOW QUALITY PROTEIN: hypothetical protein HID58_094125 [Brassica napus]|uniref:Alpha 1,4-glycosyltransferase domain-containing protein n=1 Tax=Brassica napus TaxID=3708 RepID=A0ABQ7X8J7_BRANA|nr:LOW QUALITY PROTEIN: hypothetical protein HID58_094125 [Brassica napus]
MRKNTLLFTASWRSLLPFDGNRWGHNGPYLVTRVVQRAQETIGNSFTTSKIVSNARSRNETTLLKADLIKLNKRSYGLHLWNKITKKIKIGKGSAIDIIISDHCVMGSKKLAMLVIFAVFALLNLLYMESPTCTLSDDKPPFKQNVPLPGTTVPMRPVVQRLCCDLRSTRKRGDRSVVTSSQIPTAREIIIWFSYLSWRYSLKQQPRGSPRKSVGAVQQQLLSSVLYGLAGISSKVLWTKRDSVTLTLTTTLTCLLLVILSNSLDSPRGYTILKPFLDQGFNLVAVTLDILFLVKNTPAKLDGSWLHPFVHAPLRPNKTRRALQVRRIYLDTDIIFLNSVTGLRNAIGAQSLDPETKRWTRLNNAVMVFDIYHPLMHEFLQEYSTTFDGNRWGYNSPYLVSRVIQRLGHKPEYNLTIFPPNAFYPVNWLKILRLFKKPTTTGEVKWVEKTVTRKMKIEEGSVMHKLISTHCTVCGNITDSHT